MAPVSDHDKLLARVHLHNCEELLTELDGFKNNSDFHNLGFGNASPYKAWKEKVNKLDNEMSNDKDKIGIIISAIPATIILVADDFRRSNGRGTDFTNRFFSEVLPEAKELSKFEP